MKTMTIERKGKVLAFENEMLIAGKMLSFKTDSCSLITLQGLPIEY